MLKTGDAWGFSLFADDLRQEIGGKISVMGLYQNDLILNAAEFPVTLPKLAIMVMYYEHLGEITGDLKFKVELPFSIEGVAEPEFILERSKVKPIHPALPIEQTEKPIINFRVPFVLSPLHIVSEGPIKVRCYYTDGSVLKLGRLNLIHKKTDPSLSNQ